jgi:hypothetical protein
MQGGWLANGPYLTDDAEKAYKKKFAPEKSELDLAKNYRDGRALWFVFDPTTTNERVPRLTEEPSATYLYRELDAPTERIVSASITTKQRTKVWLNGEVVHEDVEAPKDDALREA